MRVSWVMPFVGIEKSRGVIAGRWVEHLQWSCFTVVIVWLLFLLGQEM